MSKKVTIGLCGSGGYVGQVLAELILGHPHFDLVAIDVRQSAAMPYSVSPLLAQYNIPVVPFSALQAGEVTVDVLALATPVSVSMKLVAALNRDIKIIDLSGAFRLPEEEFCHWYGMAHQATAQLEGAQYGLLPWAAENNYHDHNGILANPGCYATCALMALLPLIKANLIDEQAIIIDAKSGVSGAGKQASGELMFCEMENNFFPYKVGKHQHVPEIKRAIQHYSGQSCHLRLTTHMLPIARGISMTIYTQSKQPSLSGPALAAAVDSALAAAYQHYPLVRYGALNQGKLDQDKFLLSLKSVVTTPNTHISYFIDDDKLQLFACIDNLLKGAASQAIENINAWYQLPLATGLLREEMAP